MTDKIHVVLVASLAVLLIVTLDSYRRIRTIEKQVANISMQFEAVTTEGSGEAATTEDESTVDVMPDLMDDVGKEA